MRIVVAPVIVDDRICRVVSAVESLLEVEEWAGEWWEPSMLPLTVVSLSPAADVEVLMARGVPPADYADPAPRVAHSDIEASLVAGYSAQASPMRLDEDVHRGDRPRTPVYRGNARFRRHRRDG